MFPSFLPAGSNKAKKVKEQSIRGWRLHKQTSLSLTEITARYNAVIRGWLNYYMRFYKTEMKTVIKLNFNEH